MNMAIRRLFVNIVCLISLGTCLFTASVAVWHQAMLSERRMSGFVDIPEGPFGSDPIWFVTLATSLLPSVWLCDYLWRVRRARRLRLHWQCAKCGYDLRATPERCPECGRCATAEERARSAARDKV